jgi:hypothetical protein
MYTSHYEKLRQSDWDTHSKNYCNYSAHKVFSVFTSRYLVTASNGGRSPSSGFPNCPRPRPPASHFSQLQLPADSTNLTKKSMLRPSVSLSWNKAPIWGLRPDFYYCQTVAGLLIWGALSDERTGLSFTIAAGPRQYSYSRIRVLRDSWQYFTVSDSRLHQPGGPGPRIYIPQEQGGSVILPETGFLFRRLLRLAGIRWRYY